MIGDGTTSRTYGVSGSFGTSFSSPTTAGAAALLLEENPWRTADDLAARLAELAIDTGAAGADPVFGAGRLNLEEMDMCGPSDLGDNDGDGVDNLSDSCRETVNPLQLDSNGDGYGDRCDADYDDSGSVGASDLTSFKQVFGLGFGQAGFDPQYDHDGNGAVGAADLLTLKIRFGSPPGPSCLACLGLVPCPTP